MRKARILVVDDSVVVRKLVTDVLSSTPELEVAGTAANGRIALAKIPLLQPDLVTLDMEMPELDGLGTLRAIRAAYPRLPVIMFSTLTAKGAVATLDALALGASDYVTKPANVGSVTAALDSVRREMVPKIKAFCPWCVAGPAIPAPRSIAARAPAAAPSVPRSFTQRIDVVAIGVSTGGPNALQQLFAELPGDLPVPIVVVQHMPPVFTRHLADRLTAKSRVPTCEAAAGDVLRPGRAWIAPGNFHLAIARRHEDCIVQLNQGPQENSCRPAVDVLFRSIAETYGPQSLALVMTGMGQDGLRGCEVIHRRGGQIVIQDEESSVVWGMPGAVSRAGLADRVLPLAQLAGELVRAVRRGRPAPALYAEELTR